VGLEQALALLAALDTACSSLEDLGQAAAELFQQHPDYAIITSFPGLADSTGARVLAEIGDRHIKNNRLANVGWMWAFSAASNCEPARQHYRQRRENGDRHAAANRHLFNKLLGQLHPAPLCDAA
jgi:hypothetical protein